jgi:hypothetical protein
LHQQVRFVLAECHGDLLLGAVGGVRHRPWRVRGAGFRGWRSGRPGGGTLARRSNGSAASAVTNGERGRGGDARRTGGRFSQRIRMTGNFVVRGLAHLCCARRRAHGGHPLEDPARVLNSRPTAGHAPAISKNRRASAGPGRRPALRRRAMPPASNAALPEKRNHVASRLRWCFTGRGEPRLCHTILPPSTARRP